MPTRQRNGRALAFACLLLSAVPAMAQPLAPGTPLAASQLVVTRPGMVLVDRDARRAVLQALPEAARERLCGVAVTGWPNHGVQRNVSGERQAAHTLAMTLMLAGGRYLAEADGDARDAIFRNLRRFAEAQALGRMVEPVTVNHFYNLDRTLLPIIAAYALIHDDPALDQAGKAAIHRWLDRLVRWRGPERRLDPTRVSSRNNHAYLRYSVTMAWGAFTGDNALFFAGIDRFRAALDQMREDGSLPLETDRGEMALFYQRHAIASLVVIAEIAALQGYDLYAMRGQGGGDLHRAIHFLAEAIDDPAVIEPYAREPQYLGFLDRRGHDRHYMAWLEPYRARFPDNEAAIRLAGHVIDDPGGTPMLDDYAGGATACFFADLAALASASPN